MELYVADTCCYQLSCYRRDPASRPDRDHYVFGYPADPDNHRPASKLQPGRTPHSISRPRARRSPTYRRRSNAGNRRLPARVRPAARPPRAGPRRGAPHHQRRVGYRRTRAAVGRSMRQAGDARAHRIVWLNPSARPAPTTVPEVRGNGGHRACPRRRFPAGARPALDLQELAHRLARAADGAKGGRPSTYIRMPSGACGGLVHGGVFLRTPIPNIASNPGAPGADGEP